MLGIVAQDFVAAFLVGSSASDLICQRVLDPVSAPTERLYSRVSAARTDLLLGLAFLGIWGLF